MMKNTTFAVFGLACGLTLTAANLALANAPARGLAHEPTIAVSKSLDHATQRNATGAIVVAEGQQAHVGKKKVPKKSSDGK